MSWCPQKKAERLTNPEQCTWRTTGEIECGVNAQDSYQRCPPVPVGHGKLRHCNSRPRIPLYNATSQLVDDDTPYDVKVMRAMFRHSW